MRTSQNRLPFLFVFPIIISLLISGCNPKYTDRPGILEEVLITNTPTSPLAPTSTPTIIPTYTPSPEPLGQADNPIVMGFIQSDNDEVVRDSAATLIDYLYTNTGLSIEAQFFLSYQEAEDALINNQLHFVWFGSIEYILASNKLLVRSALVSNHLGVTSYGIRILSHIDSPYISFFDEANNESTADIYTALTQFSGSRPCFAEEPSLTGNLIPNGLFMQASVPLLKPVITFTTAANLHAIYTKEICDFTSTYSSFGDPRTASDIQRDLPDIMDKVQIIWQSDSMIPNLNLSYSPNLELPLQDKIIEALKTFVKTTEGQVILSKVTDYSIEDLVPIDDSSYDYLRFLLTSQELDLYSILLSE